MIFNQVPALDDPVCFKLSNITVSCQKEKAYIMDEF